jgi:predicted phosphate transport protein (TIGR00153 family)
MIFNWFSRARAKKVLSMVESQIELSLRTVKELDCMIDAESKGVEVDSKRCYTNLSEMEKKADELKHEMIEELTKREMLPDERGDLMELIRAINWITDWSREAARLLDIISFETLPEEMKDAVKNMSKKTIECVAALTNCVGTISNDREETISLAKKVEAIEEEVDDLYNVARKYFATLEFKGFTPGALILLNMFLDALETVADWCEHSVDIIRSILVRMD